MVYDMLSLIEKKLLNDVADEERKRAERLLKSGDLLFLYPDKKIIHALFRDSSTHGISVSVPLDASSEVLCTCGADEKWCVHALAAALHFLRYSSNILSPPPQKPTYGGLKRVAAEDLPGGTEKREETYLTVWVENQPPHAPSKWEKCNITIKISSAKREYSGNVSNLKQLSFGQGLGAELRIAHFSPQERQIIRFLSLNAESNGQKLLLDAESAAEFFHSLVEFKRCFFTVPLPDKVSKLHSALLPYSSAVKNSFFVHRSSGRVILNYKKTGENYKLQPALLTDSGILSLKDFRMLAGRSGCWISTGNDYWWIPGDVDLIWLRSFLLAGGGKYDAVKAGEIMANAEKNSVPLIASALRDSLPTEKGTPSYHASFDDDDTFLLTLSFIYDKSYFHSYGVNVSGSGRYAWKRDRKFEKACESELIAMGFLRRPPSGSIYRLDSPEIAGLFIDKCVTEWYKSGRNMLFSAEFARICHGGHGIPELIFSCSIVDDSSETVSISYSLSTSSDRDVATWKNLLDIVKKNRKYLYDNGNFAGRIPDKLTDFIKATGDFTQLSRDNKNILYIPKSTLLYWGEEFEKLTGSVPAPVKRLKDALTPADELEHDKKRTTATSGNKENIQPQLFRGELRSYQREGVKWIERMLDNNLNVILADEMGLGKTVQTIALLCQDIENFPDTSSSLILCPSSLVENWKMEFAKFAPELDAFMLTGSRRKKQYGELKKADVVITSYTLAGRDIEELRKHRFRFLILDEAQHIKNPSTVNAATAKTLKADYKIVLTGTPLENSPEELWSIFDFLHPKMLGSLSSFRRRYTGIRDDDSMQHTLAMRTAPFIMRRQKDDVEPDLPKKVVQTLYCEMGIEQRRIYDKFKEEGIAHFGKLLKSGKSSRFDLFTNLLRLRQICSHPDLLINAGATIPDNIISAKTELLQELLLESIDSGHKVLVFSQFTSFLAIIRQWLLDKQIPFEYLDGSTKERLKKVNHFNKNSDIPIFLLSLKAGGVGLNLTSADRVIIYDPWWNPAVEAQATDRTHRIGQKRSVYSMKLVVKNSIEEKILKLQSRKQKIFQNLVENRSASLKNLSDEDIEFLLA